MEKILVGLKRVVDYNVRIRVKTDGSGVETDGVKMSINPFDEIALEEALRIRERGEASEVVVFSIGSADAQQQLRTGLAMGADRAILVETADAVDPLSAARAIVKLVEAESPDLVVLGKQAIDNDNNQTGQMVAALWDRPLNEPRYVKLPDIMKAKKKPLDTKAFAELGIETDDAFEVTEYAPPPQRSKGVMVEDSAALVAALKDKGLI